MQNIIVDQLYSTATTAERLQIKQNTLERWRSAGVGPAFIKVGRLVRYPESAIVAYLKEQFRTSTTQKSATKSYPLTFTRRAS